MVGLEVERLAATGGFLRRITASLNAERVGHVVFRAGRCNMKVAILI